MLNVKYEMWNVKCEMWNVKCIIYGLKKQKIVETGFHFHLKLKTCNWKGIW